VRACEKWVVEVVYAKHFFFLVPSNRRIATPIVEVEAVAIVEVLQVATFSKNLFSDL
jgi:hypothetical protein